jgi:hypothetical protein
MVTPRIVQVLRIVLALAAVHAVDSLRGSLWEHMTHSETGRKMPLRKLFCQMISDSAQAVRADRDRTHHSLWKSSGPSMLPGSEEAHIRITTHYGALYVW